MDIDWTASGLDLYLRAAAGAGRRDGLERALREAIRAGRLTAGTRLPASRGLAVDVLAGYYAAEPVRSGLVIDALLTVLADIGPG